MQNILVQRKVISLASQQKKEITHHRERTESSEISAQRPLVVEDHGAKSITVTQA